MNEDLRSEITLPEAFQLTEEQKKVKSYAIGTISIDANGVFHCTYIGHHKVFKREYFGNGVESSFNIVSLLYKVASRINKKKDLYLSQILELEKTNDNTTNYTDSARP